MPPITVAGEAVAGSCPQSSGRKEAHRRSLAKAVSWRATGSIDTFILSFLITGSVKIAGSISAVELITKIALFYLHERIWAVVPWGGAEHHRAVALGLDGRQSRCG